MKFGEDTCQLDDIDRKLLTALQRDAKTPLAKLGEKVGLSAPAVMERLRKLEQADVITGYHATVDARRIGIDVAAFIGVAVSAQRIDPVEEWVDGQPEILECHHVTGGHTLLLKVKVRNTRALERLISSIRSLEGVNATETMVVLSTHTERVRLALETDSDEPPAEPARGRRARAKKAS